MISGNGIDSIDNVELERASLAAEKLKAHFLQQEGLIGMEKGYWSCACGSNHSDHVVIEDVEYPNVYGNKPSDIGLWSKWHLKVTPVKSLLRKPRCVYNIPLKSMFSQWQLFPLFRNAFAGINVPVQRPPVFIQYAEHASQQDQFTEGHLVDVHVDLDQSLLLRVKEVSDNSPFTSVEFRLTRAWGPFSCSSDRSLIFMRTEPYQRVFQGGQESTVTIDDAIRVDVSKLPSYTVRVEKPGSVAWLPVFRILELDASLGHAHLLLHDSVEVC